MAVHRELGPGFLEGVYQEALVVELKDRGIPCSREVSLWVYYKGRRLEGDYRADLVCFAGAVDEAVLVELKAVERLTDALRAQVIHTMRATGIRRALLINFGGNALEFERWVLG
jgi:GxxExxY protein